jgi:L-asparagine permease
MALGPFVTFFTGIGIPYAGDIIQVIVLTAALSSLNAGLYSTIGEEGVEGDAQQAKGSGHGDAAGRHVVTVELGCGLWSFAGHRQRPQGLNAFLPDSAFEIVMNLAGIGIAGTWAMVLLSHTR